MERNITIFGLLVLFPGMLAAQLAIGSAVLAPGRGAIVPVLFKSASPISALQFDVHFEDAVLLLEPIVGDTPRLSAKNVYVASLPHGKRFVIAALNAGSLGGGTLLYLYVSSFGAAEARSYPLELSNIAAASASGDNVPLAYTGGSVAVLANDSADGGLRPGNILNAASFLTGPIAAGEIVTVVGEGFLPGVDAPASEATVQFDGNPAKLLSIQLNRFNVVVPYGIGNGQETLLTLRYQDRLTASVTLPLARAAPGIFTLDWTGTGQAVVVNQDDSINSASNPAAADSILTLFATGIGPDIPLSVRIQGQECQVVMISDGSIPGIMPIRVRVPRSLETNGSAIIDLEAAGAKSQPGVTLAIR